jgi:Bifunctional DNA primase/polymerase, N-terminal
MARDFNRDWALRLVDAGLAIFPCGDDKKPLVKWREFSSSDADAVAQWWARYPNALPAIDLEKCGLFVLDGDRHGGPDGRAALRDLLRQQKVNGRTTPAALTPGDGVHVYFAQNGHELTNARGNLPPGIDARGAGGYTIAPYAVLADGRRYKSVHAAPDLISAFKAGTIPHVPQGIVDLIRVREQTDQPEQPNFNSKAGVREKAFAQAALQGSTAELAGTAPGERNETLNKIAYRLGRMVARRWLERAAVEGALLGAMYANGYIGEEGTGTVAATLKSGLDAGITEPHPDLAERDEAPANAPGETPQHPPRTLADVHEVFRKWLGEEFDLDAINAVLAAAASEQLAGDPLWLLVISGPGNAKTETVQALSGAGAHVTSTITSEGALLSATPRRERNKKATGGLLRKIGDRGVLVIKDVTSILSADRNVRGTVLAAVREIYDGRRERNVGSDGGLTLTWVGRIVIIGAVTTAWDSAHAVVAAMGDRFVLIRVDSRVGRIKAGKRAVSNTGSEVSMRQELAGAVGGLLGHINTTADYTVTEEEGTRLLEAADIVTTARTAVERDYKGEVIDAHAPESRAFFFC